MLAACSAFRMTPRLAKVPLPNLQAKLQFLQQELSAQMFLQLAALGPGGTDSGARSLLHHVYDTAGAALGGGACDCLWLYIDGGD